MHRACCIIAFGCIFLLGENAGPTDASGIIPAASRCTARGMLKAAAAAYPAAACDSVRHVPHLYVRHLVRQRAEGMMLVRTLRLRGSGLQVWEDDDSDYDGNDVVDQQRRGSRENVAESDKQGGMENVDKQGDNVGGRPAAANASEQLGVDELSAWEETTTESEVKRGEVRPDPGGFPGSLSSNPNP